MPSHSPPGKWIRTRAPPVDLSFEAEQSMQVEVGLRFVLSWGSSLNSGRGRVREVVHVKRADLSTRRGLVEHAERTNEIQKRRRIVRRFDQRKAIVETDALGADSKPLEHPIQLRQLLLLTEARRCRRYCRCIGRGRQLCRRARGLSQSWRKSLKRGLRGALKLNEVRNVHRRRRRKHCGKRHGVRPQHS